MATGAAIAGVAISKRSADKARKAGRGPAFIRTGRSTLDTQGGNINLDPTIRARQDQSFGRLEDLRDPTNSAFANFGKGISTLRDDLSTIRGDFESNKSAFSESVLNPVLERFAQEEGQLDRELGRRGVFGTFAAQTGSIQGQRFAREEADIRAKVENQRLETLGNLLQIDQNLLRSSLESETGRVQFLSELENQLLGITKQQFNQEADLLGIQRGPSDAQAAAERSSIGVQEQAKTKAVGAIFSAFAGGGTSSVASGSAFSGNPHR